MAHKWVYLFEEVDEAEAKTGSWDGTRALLGGKGANLGDMVRISSIFGLTDALPDTTSIRDCLPSSQPRLT